MRLLELKKERSYSAIEGRTLVLLRSSWRMKMLHDVPFPLPLCLSPILISRGRTGWISSNSSLHRWLSSHLLLSANINLVFYTTKLMQIIFSLVLLPCQGKEMYYDIIAHSHSLEWRGEEKWLMKTLESCYLSQFSSIFLVNTFSERWHKGVNWMPIGRNC